VQVTVVAPPHNSSRPLVPTFAAALDYPLQSGLIQPVRARRRLATTLDGATEAAQTKGLANRALQLNGNGAVRTSLLDIDDAATLECWVNGKQPKSWNGLVSKTQSSGYGLTWSDDGAHGSVRLLSKSSYLTCRGAVPETEWVHLAWSWDGKTSRLFVNGKLAEERKAQGAPKWNRLPLFVGADTNRYGDPEARFKGMIDEVRVSNIGRYSADFTPQRRFAPDANTRLLLHFDQEFQGLYPDASGQHHHGWPVGKTQLVDVTEE